MKNRILKVMVCAFPLLWGACEKPYDETKKIGPPRFNPEQIMTVLEGKWQMLSAKQVDEKSLTKESIDITDFFTQEPGSNVPTLFFKSDFTFTADTTGVAVDYFGVTSGKWNFDDPAYPTVINLSDANDLPVGSIGIGANLLSLNPMLLYTKSAMCGEEKAFTYNLEFLKQQ
ncbi:MAG: DUF5004 domain-containing protein [Bacteroidota bacterium]